MIPRDKTTKKYYFDEKLIFQLYIKRTKHQILQNTIYQPAAVKNLYTILQKTDRTLSKYKTAKSTTKTQNSYPFTNIIQRNIYREEVNINFLSNEKFYNFTVIPI